MRYVGVKKAAAAHAEGDAYWLRRQLLGWRGDVHGTLAAACEV